MGKRSDNDFVSKALSEGLSKIIEEHPKFRHHQQYIFEHISAKKRDELINKLVEHCGEKKLSQQNSINYVQKGLVTAVVNGDLFDERAKHVILKDGLKEANEAKFDFESHKKDYNFFKRRRESKKIEEMKSNAKNENYIDRAIQAFGDLYSLMKSHPSYGVAMPDLERDLVTVSRLGFLDPALEILKEYNLIDDSKYGEMRKSAHQTAKASVQRVQSGLEKYAHGHTQRIAASVVGFLGVALILSSGLKITGNMVSSAPASQLSFGFWSGFALLGVALVLALNSLRHE